MAKRPLDDNAAIFHSYRFYKVRLPTYIPFAVYYNTILQIASLVFSALPTAAAVVVVVLIRAHILPDPSWHPPEYPCS